MLGTYFSFFHKQTKKEVLPITENKEVGTEQIKELPEKEVTTKASLATLEINGVPYQTQILEPTSVYDFMNKLKNERKIAFKDKTFIGIGKFIEEIDGIRSDGDRYWIYYVNGKKATIGVSNYEINSGDVVSWKYEKEIY